jgi:DAPG hydrolase PhiG domain
MRVQEGYHRMKNGAWKITANHEIGGVIPQMIDWWWDHIDTSERYRLWHPTDHVSFEWLISPAEHGHIGAVHRVQEFLNGTPEHPLTLEIRWEDPVKAPDAEYDHILLATGTDTDNLLKATLMHEYQYDTTRGGTRMRSHFWFPSQAPQPAIEALYSHTCQEMTSLSTFLPGLYQAEGEHRPAEAAGSRRSTVWEQEVGINQARCSTDVQYGARKGA